MKAKDLMSAPAIAVQPETPLKEIVQILSERGIGTVPVVDGAGRVMGLIGWGELFPTTRYIKASDVRAPVLFKRVIDLQTMAEHYKHAAEKTAQDIMAPCPHCADVEDRVQELVKVMVEENLHMLPILNEDRLVGVLTRSDFIRFLAKVL